jgi:hypothetical protein
MNGTYRQRIKQAFINSFGNKCCVCKESYDMVVYDFHHVNPNKKKFAISQWRANESLLKEIQKCVLVCSNCHRLLESGEVSVPKNAIRFKDKNLRHCRKILNEVIS